MAGAVTGREEHLDVKAREAQDAPPASRCSGTWLSNGPNPGGVPSADVFEHGTFDLRAIDGRAGRPREGRDSADVVEVAVGDEDRLDLHAELLDRAQQPVGLFAGVDDHGLRGSGPAGRCKRSPAPARR